MRHDAEFDGFLFFLFFLLFTLSSSATPSQALLQELLTCPLSLPLKLARYLLLTLLAVKYSGQQSLYLRKTQMFSFLIGTEEAKHELNYISINKERIK